MVEENIKAFNKGFLDLLGLVEAIQPKNDDVHTAQLAVNQMIRADELGVLKVFGPELFMFKERIMVKDVEFFFSRDFSDYGEETVGIVNKVKLSFQECSDEEKNIMADRVIEITKTYIRYILEVRKMRASA
jgi:hypothetical protein